MTFSYTKFIILIHKTHNSHTPSLSFSHTSGHSHTQADILTHKLTIIKLHRSKSMPHIILEMPFIHRIFTITQNTMPCSLSLDEFSIIRPPLFEIKAPCAVHEAAKEFSLVSSTFARKLAASMHGVASPFASVMVAFVYTCMYAFISVRTSCIHVCMHVLCIYKCTCLHTDFASCIRLSTQKGCIYTYTQVRIHT
jgi:hypothetical protein